MRYFFHIGGTLGDLEGLVLPDVATARAEGLQLVSQLLRQAEPDTRQNEWRVDVSDTSGRSVFVIRVEVTDAAAPRPF